MYALAWMAIFTSGATALKLAPSTVLSDVFFLPALGHAVLVAFYRRRPFRIPRIIDAVCWLLILVSLALALFGVVTLLSVAYVVRLVVIVVGMPMLFITYGRTVRRWRGLLAAYVLSAAGNGLLAGLDDAGVHIASRAVGFTGYLYNGGRYEGLAATPNQLGMMCVLASPILAYLADTRRAWWWALPPLLLGVLVSGSRGAVLGVPIAALAYVICRRRHRVRTLVVLGVAGVAGYAAAIHSSVGVGVTRLFVGGATATISDQQRIANAAQASGDFLAHPIFGVGFGLPEAHNTYLELLRDGGMVLALPLFGMLGWTLAACFRLRSPRSAAPAAAVGTWLLLNAQFDGVYDRYLWVPFGAAVALIVWGRSDRPVPADHRRYRKHRHPRRTDTDLPQRRLPVRARL